GDLHVNAASQPGAATGQLGRGVEVRGVDDHVTGQHGAGRVTTVRGGQGPGRAHPVAEVHHRRPQLPEPCPPCLLILWRRGAARLGTESETVLAHRSAPIRPGPASATGLHLLRRTTPAQIDPAYHEPQRAEGGTLVDTDEPFRTII